jgi:hypothetical protein
VVDLGSSAYSSLAVLAAPATSAAARGSAQQAIKQGSGDSGDLGDLGGDAGAVVGVLYERAGCEGSACPLVFLPDHISWVNVTL